MTAESDRSIGKQEALAHVPDAAWLIALWKFIHGGDPSPLDRHVAAHIVAAMVPVLGGRIAEPVALGRLQEELKAIGGEITATRGERRKPEPDAAMEGSICCESVTVCVGKPPRCHTVCIQRVSKPNECM